VINLPIQEDRGRLFWRCPACRCDYSVALVAVGDPDDAGTLALRAHVDDAERVDGHWVCYRCARKTRGEESL
jgi:hypothetical protein